MNTQRPRSGVPPGRAVALPGFGALWRLNGGREEKTGIDADSGGEDAEMIPLSLVGRLTSGRKEASHGYRANQRRGRT